MANPVTLPNPPVVIQGGQGTSPGYSAVDLRRLASNGAPMGEGARDIKSFHVIAQTGMNVQAELGEAWVRGDSVTDQALYYCHIEAALQNLTVPTADPTNPRIDMVVLEVKDSAMDGSGGNEARLRVVTGTASAGATLENRTGAAAQPNTAILLADILVPAASASVTEGNIRDRRPFAFQIIPPLITKVDQVPMVPYLAPLEMCTSAHAEIDVHQSATLCALPRRIVGATRIRWKYRQSSTEALAGNYILAIFDASGRLVVSTSVTAWAGTVGTFQTRSETISATTFEAGMYYVFMGNDSTAGTAFYRGISTTMITTGTGSTPTVTPNVSLALATGGTTVPNTILGFQDVITLAAATALLAVPQVSLSVG